MRGATSALIQKLKNIEEVVPVQHSDESSDAPHVEESSNISGSETHRFAEGVTLDFRRVKEKEVRDLLRGGDAGRSRMEELLPFERVDLLYGLVKEHGIPNGAWLGE